MLNKRAASKASSFLTEYAKQRGIFMRINYFNADHTHALIDLPTNICIEEVIKLLKGSSSHWLNQPKLLKGHFAWGRGSGAFSVSHSDLDRVTRYIANREEHHRINTYAEEFEMFIKRYGLEWRDDGNR